MLQSWINKFLWWLVDCFPHRKTVLFGEGQQTPYLMRFYVKHSGWLPGVYLHYFYRGDQERELHNHPWKKSFSFILTGWYLEARRKELRNGKHVVIFRTLRAGNINCIRANDFHRIDTVVYPLWTLFFSGKRVQSWGFWDRHTGKYVDHKEFFSNASSYTNK